PLPDLGGANRRINGLAVQNFTSSAKPIMYVDRVGLLGSGSPSSPTATASATPAPSLSPVLGSTEWNGANWSGLEYANQFGGGPGGRSELDLTATAADTLKSNGVKLLRLTFTWELMQPSLYGPLDPTYKQRIHKALAILAARGMKGFPDPHNYGRYGGQTSGSSAV